MKAERQPSPTADELWSAYQAHRSDEIREQLIEHYRPLALKLARRLRYPRDEDLEQIGMIGLVKAVDRFDPTRENGFYSFAVPTILGEVKRYLRDQSHLIRCSRTLHDLRDLVRTREQAMTRASGRVPTLVEVAVALGIEQDRVTEAMALEELCQPCCLDAPLSGQQEEPPLTLDDCVGGDDPDFRRVEDRIVWDEILNHLSPRLKVLIELRFFHELSQREVGQRLGISQMQVSRLERRALASLHAQAAAG